MRTYDSFWLEQQQGVASVPKTIHRLPRACELLGEPESTVYAKTAPESCMYDPDHPKPIRIGRKSIGFDADEILRYQLLNQAKRDGVPADEIKHWIDERFLEEKALAERVAEYRARTERPTKRRKMTVEVADVGAT
jgi:predicted DNA-binding transcriptional regulator AlpA